MILALDPSSQCTGYAVLDAAGALRDGGRITPSLARSVTAPLPAWLAAHVRASRPGIRRVFSMLPDVRELLDAEAWSAVVVELPSGLAGSGSKAGASGSLGVLGLAQGAVWATALLLRPAATVGVDERTWTRGYGITKKPERQADVAVRFAGQYQPATDPGADVSDAIALGLWWQRQRTSSEEAA